MRRARNLSALWSGLGARELKLLLLYCINVSLCLCEQEAIAIVLDVGPSMNQAPPGAASSMETAIEGINMILQRKVRNVPHK